MLGVNSPLLRGEDQKEEESDEKEEENDDLAADLRAAAPGAIILTLRFFRNRGVHAPESLRRQISAIREAVRPVIEPITVEKEQEEAGDFLLVGIDHEGGFVQHLPPPGFTLLPTFGALGRACAKLPYTPNDAPSDNDDDDDTGEGDNSGQASDDPTPRDARGLAREVGAVAGRELSAVGIDWSFGPVVDVRTTAGYHFRTIERTLNCLGDPEHPNAWVEPSAATVEWIGQLGAEVIRGMQASGVAACPKHFPGMGATDDDSHVEVPRVLSFVAETHLPPFATAFGVGGAWSTMTNHAFYDDLDADNVATLSSVVLSEILREQLRFEGVVLSDDLGMRGVMEGRTVGEVAVDALNAGVDCLMFSFRWRPSEENRAEEAVRAICDAVAEGRLSRQRLQEAHDRIADMKQRIRISRQQPAYAQAQLEYPPSCEFHKVVANAAGSLAGVDTNPSPPSTVGSDAGDHGSRAESRHPSLLGRVKSWFRS
jgi:beta-glucosidase-like glycosyl hydrolase